MQKTYIDKNLENQRALSYHQKIHQGKLNQIAQIGQPLGTNKQVVVRPQEARQVEAGLRKFKAEKKKAADFQQSEKNIVISRENQILLSKLVDISNGKWSSVPAASQTQSRKRVSASQNRAYKPTSLNLVVRKKETERIERENHAFAKRLFDKQAIVAKKNLDKDYSNHLKYKRAIAKMPGAQSKAKGRVMTRGAPGTTGMSAGQLMMDQQQMEGYPREPSHFLGQAPQNMDGNDQVLAQSQAFENEEENAQRDSSQMIATSEQLGQQPQIQATAQEPVVNQQQEETKNQTAAPATAVVNNNNVQQ